MGRNARFSQWSLVVMIAAWIFPQQAMPAETFVYEFMPGSQFTVAGGLLTINEMYQIAGTVHLALDLDLGDASFADVDAHLVGAGDFNGASLESVWNLAAASGQALDESDIRFSGTDNQGIPWTMEIVRTPMTITVRAENAPGCCDFYSYGMSGVAMVPEPAGLAQMGCLLMMVLGRHLRRRG